MYLLKLVNSYCLTRTGSKIFTKRRFWQKPIFSTQKSASPKKNQQSQPKIWLFFFRTYSLAVGNFGPDRCLADTYVTTHPSVYPKPPKSPLPAIWRVHMPQPAKREVFWRRPARVCREHLRKSMFHWPDVGYQCLYVYMIYVYILYIYTIRFWESEAVKLCILLRTWFFKMNQNWVVWDLQLEFPFQIL